MKARDLQAYLRSLNGGWMDLEVPVHHIPQGCMYGLIDTRADGV